MTKMEQDIYANMFGNQVAPENYYKKIKNVEVTPSH